MDVLHQRLIVAAQGYSELDLPDEALAELERLPDEVRTSPLAMEMRLAILMQAHRYKDALPVGREMCRLAPTKTGGFIHAAFCLHELGKTGEARDVLLAGPPEIQADATFHYNLACYEAVLGNLAQAQVHLSVSFAMDTKFKEYAMGDPDLKALQLGKAK